MPNPYFKFKQFTIHHDRCAMKVTTDSCFFGAWVAEEIKNEKLKIKNALDIGTGTGLLSLMAAQKNCIEIDAVEIDVEASQQAKENIEASPWKKQVHVFKHDILSFHPGKKYDCIISNPPFYEKELTSLKQNRNIAHHSAELTIAQVLNSIKIHLQEDGVFFLLLPFKRKEEIESLLQKHQLYISHSIDLRQSVKHPPFRILIKGKAKKPIDAASTTMAIWDEHQQYTNEFVDLLKDYYLYL